MRSNGTGTRTLTAGSGWRRMIIAFNPWLGREADGEGRHAG
ncbi:hypothetical protein ES708_17728 [subsurface metagenome]